MNAVDVNAFRLFTALGYPRVIPIIPPGVSVTATCSVGRKLAKGTDGRGKAPGIKLPSGLWTSIKDWETLTPTPVDLDNWHRMGAGTGIKCGFGVVAIDADCLDPAHAAIVREEIEKRIGVLPVRVGRAPKALYLCRSEGDVSLPYSRVTYGDGDERVEILSAQFVVAGTHPSTLNPYRWEGDPPPFDKLPAVTPETLSALLSAVEARLPKGVKKANLSALKPVDQKYLVGDLDLVREAVEDCPNHFARRSDYVEHGFAIRAALPFHQEEAFEIWKRWCEKWDGGENDIDTITTDWESFKPPYRVGASFLFDHAWAATNGRNRGRQIALARKHFEPLREESQDNAPTGLIGTPFDFPDPTEIEPEEFMYDAWLVRDYVSLIAAQTKVGKSLFAIAVALSLCSGKPLLGVTPDALYRVRLWNGEDTRSTLNRRVLACMKHFGLKREDIQDRLIFDSGRDQPIVMAAQTRAGTVIHRPLVDSLVLGLQNQKVDVLIVDPFIKIHQVSENDNAAIDIVAREWVDVTTRAHVGLVLVHHSRKLNGSEASIDDSRGASALPSAARSALVMARMTKREAKTLGRSKDYKGLFRIADAASNLAAAPADDEKWYEIRSIDLCNARFDASGRQIRRSDRIGVATLSATVGGADEEEVPQTAETADREAQALKLLAAGEYKRGMKAGDSWAGAAVAIAYRLNLDDPDDKVRAGAIVARLVREGKLKEVAKPDKYRKVRVFVEVKKAEIIAPDNNLLSPDDLFA